jgi:catechol 2,3-dioxygenase-like lactoylglutathione lyase family enzyme
METYNVGNGHLGLVVDDLEAEYERLRAAGASFRHPGPVEVDGGDWKGTKALYMRDPDGITIELMESPPPFSLRFA